jgi:hypothetical protein
VGRNINAADKIISDCAELCPEGQSIFSAAEDLALVTDVDLVCSEIMKLETENAKDGTPRIDLLYMTQGRLIFGPRLGTAQTSSIQ